MLFLTQLEPSQINIREQRVFSYFRNSKKLPSLPFAEQDAISPQKKWTISPTSKLHSSIFEQPIFSPRIKRTKSGRPKHCRVGRYKILNRHARGAIPTWTLAESSTLVLNQQAYCHDSDSMPEKPRIRISADSPSVRATNALH